MKYTDMWRVKRWWKQYWCKHKDARYFNMVFKGDKFLYEKCMNCGKIVNYHGNVFLLIDLIKNNPKVWNILIILFTFVSMNSDKLQGTTGIAVRCTQDDFYETYLNCVAHAFGLKSGWQIKILAELYKKSDSSGKVYIPAPAKKVLCDKLKMKPGMFSVLIHQLKECGAIQGSWGIYVITPVLFLARDKYKDGIAVCINVIPE